MRDYNEVRDLVRLGENGEILTLVRGEFVKAKQRKTANGYMTVYVNMSSYYVHRLIYMLNNNGIPKDLYIDHIDGNRGNNHVSNLRAVTHRENCGNKPRHRAGALCGCYLHKRSGLWCTSIEIQGEIVYCGHKPTELEANQLYRQAVSLVGSYTGDKDAFRALLGTYKGVVGYTFDKSYNKWKAVLYVEGKTVYLASFTTEADAKALAVIGLSKISQYQNPVQFRDLLGVTKKKKGYTWDDKIHRWKTIKSFKSKSCHIACFKTEEEAIKCSELFEVLKDNYDTLVELKAEIMKRLKP